MCRGSGEIMNHDNPPVALPNGQVFSKAFVMSQARPKEKSSTRKLSAWEKLKLHKDKARELDETSHNGGTSSESNDVGRSDKSDKSEKMSSIFGGCYCGGSVNGDLSACVSPSSTTASSVQPHACEGQKESGISNMGGGKPLSAIEVMMRLSGGWKSENLPSVDRRALAVTSLASEMMRRRENEEAVDNAARLDEDQDREGGSGRRSSEHEHDMSDSPPLPPPPLYFTCPVTGSSFDISTLKAVFIV